jgi:hypothetical protein
MDRHQDLVAVTGERFINRVVNNLVHEVMKPAGAGRADVHAGTLADGLEAFEDRDVLRVVSALILWALGRAVVVCQRSSDDVETPRKPR